MTSLKDDKILVVENLTKKFGGLTAVNSINMYVNKNEIVGLIGANGAGKTTLFNMISGTLKPTLGSVVFKGLHIENLKPYKICKMGVGRTYQIVKPFAKLTVLDNVMVGALINTSNLEIARQKAEDVLKFIGMYERKDVKGSELNLPELKRLEVAKALATEPEILLLDEVMAGLNPTECNNVIEMIKKVRDNGVTIIVIEHVMKAIMSLSGRIYVLNQGNLIAEGAPQEVVNNPEVIKSYLGGKKHA